MSPIRINSQLYSPENIHLLAIDGEPWKVAIVEFLQNWYNSQSFIEVQTSGSTGEPKTIKLSKASMVNSARMTCNYFGLTEESNALLCLPADYIAGKMMIVRAIVSRMNLAAVKPTADPFAELNSILDFAAITPYQFINSYQSIQETPVKKVIVGGSQVSLRLQKLMENIETEFYETYGMTETCSHIALRKLNGKDVSEYFEILNGVSINLDERNCLKIKASALTENELITNDVVELKGEKHFKWLGRYDNVINSAGIKIFPEQVEKKIEPLLDRRFFIGALPDEVLNQKLVLIIEGTEFANDELLQLHNNLGKFLNKFEKPKEILFYPQFEVSSSGKQLKAKILSTIQKS